jgi:multidrug efflux pump subunit AcrB
MSSITQKQKTEIHKGAIAWMAHHAVAANILMLICIVGGFMVAGRIKQEVFPEMTLDKVTVSVSYPGASPEEVEKGIILAIEENLRGLEGVDEITSSASEGSANVTVTLLEGEDLQKLANDIESEVDKISSFPDDAEDPKVSTVSRQREVIELVVFGDTSERVLDERVEQIRDTLLQDEHITQMEIRGISDLEISVDVPMSNLRRYGLTLSDIASKISTSSIEIPAGGIKTEGGEILVRMQQRRDYGQEFAQIPIISNADGTYLLLGDIATVTDGYEDDDSYAAYNGKKSARIDVYRVGDQTPMEVASAVKSYLPQIRGDLPPGIGVKVLDDKSELLSQRINLLLKNGATGLVLVLLVLGLFLEIRLAFWVMMGIPISFLGTFLFMPALDVSINMISLFAYIISLGIVVDDAIVVGENIYNFRHKKGLSYLDAAIRGAKSVAVPITYSVLSNIVAFLPLYFVPGFMGKIFKIIPMVVCTVFLISLFESLFVLPSHLRHEPSKDGFIFAKIHAAQQRFSNWFVRWSKDCFGPFLKRVIRYRYIVVSLAFLFLAVSGGYVASGRLGFSLFPKVESDFAEVEVVLPYGTPVEKMKVISDRLVKDATTIAEKSGHPELIEGIFSRLGYGGSHTLQVRAYLADSNIRENIMSTEEFIVKWRKEFGEVAGAEYVKFASDSGGPGSGAAITVQLSHRDIAVLEKAGEELAAKLSEYALVKDVDDGFEPGKQQINFKMLPKGESLGLTASYVARQIRNAYSGVEAVQQQRGRKELKVKVRLPKDERISQYNLDEMIIISPTGAHIPLKDVVEVEKGRAYTTINRMNGRRVIEVEADVSPRSAANVVLDDLKQKGLPELMEKYPGLSYSMEGRQADQRESMESLLFGFVFAMGIIFVLLAIPFQSYLQPLIVMVSVPFGVIGAVLGHMIMGYSLSIMSMMGIVALSGVVVNDALVLIDYANGLRKEEGLSYFDAVLEAGIKRLRPVLLTTFTTFFGLMPMIFETEMQAKFLIPMAISLGFGVLIATQITLLVVPSLYVVLDDLKHFVKDCKKTMNKFMRYLFLKRVS